MLKCSIRNARMEGMQMETDILKETINVLRPGH